MARPRHPARVWVLWSIGMTVLLATPLVLWDPALIALALDPELLALVIAVGISMTRLSVVALRVRLRRGAGAARDGEAA